MFKFNWGREILDRVFSFGIVMVVTFSMIQGCSSPPKKVAFGPQADPAAEVNSLARDMSQARQNQADLLSPRFFEKAQDFLEEAQGDLRKGRGRETILDQVGMARAYLNFANEQTDRVRPSAQECLQARNQAISAGAIQFQNRSLLRADRAFKDMTEEAEKKRTTLEIFKRSECQNKYADVQIESAKDSRLGSIQKSIAQAKDHGAKRLAPRSLAAAEAEVQIAEGVIEGDRNNFTSISRATLEARRASNKLLRVTEIARSKNVSEPLAMEIDSREMAAENERNRLNEVESLARQERESREALQSEMKKIEEQNEMLMSENESLARQNQINQAYEWAQTHFPKNQAEVFRKGDVLIIRLKAMHYNPGQVELPASAHKTLDQVKEVISRVGAEKVRIEGHTDSIGSKSANEEVSQRRAEKVAEYLAQGQTMREASVETQGMGFDKPISSNASKEGRSQNRRVEIILTPGSVGAATSVPGPR